MPEKNDDITLDQVLNEKLSLRVYGKPIKSDLSIKADSSKTIASPGTALSLVSVGGFAYSSLCKRLPFPVLLALPGAGNDPADGDTCAAPREKVWAVPFGSTSLVLVPENGPVEELLEQIELKGIDGGIRLENPRIENGKACVTVHIWAQIKIFGRKIGFDERVPVCIPLEGCHTVWSIGWAGLEVCFRAPKKLCAKLCVGKWGLSKCWDYCVDLPITHSAVEECACKET